MIFTLHRYIFRELFKVFLLSAVALTLILTLGSILRPIQEYGVGPRQVVHLMGYFLPIFLTFVLPMAALFAGTLVYGRFAGDNELDACRAGGVGMLTLIYPGLALAVMVAIANLMLSFHVMPAFVRRAERALKADAKQIIFRNIQRRGYYELKDGGYLIYADHADPQENILSGVIVTQLDESRIREITVAENAKVNFDPHKNFNQVRITAYNTYQMSPDEQGGFSAEWIPVTAPFPSLLGDEIKFKKLDEMKKIRLDLTEFYPINKKAGDVYAQFTTELLAQNIEEEISSEPGSFYKLLGEPNSVEFTAGSCSVLQEEKVLLSGGVFAAEFDTDTGQTLRTLTAEKAFLHIEGDKFAPTLTLDIYHPTWRHPDGTDGLAQRHIIRGLLLPNSITNMSETNDVLETIKPEAVSAALHNNPGLRLSNLQKELAREISKTLTEIKAEMHSRLVFGIGCVPMIIIGIGLGIILKGGHPLAAFGVSCIPAAVLIVGILTGRNLTKNPAAPADSGVIMMWAALAFLGLLAITIHRRLLKT
ncbi:LptF/LptG family permease [Planctomycetota bacterium]